MHETSLAAADLAVFMHGGNVEAAMRLFPQAPQPWLDLSTGINPRAYPYADAGLDKAALTRLPAAEAIAALEAAAARFYGVPDATCVVAAPGSQALIQWLPRLVPAARVGILGFTYAEHARSWRACGAHVTSVDRLEELARMDVGVIVNPNNPDGRFVEPKDLRALAETMAAQRRLLVVDEAFVDFLGAGASLAPILPAEGAVVLRSFGKAFGLPGLRLGFAVAPPAYAISLRAALGPWAVGGSAIAIGLEAFGDPLWFSRIREELVADAHILEKMLAAVGFACVGATPLYRLVAHPEAAGIFDRLGRAGILVRPFAHRPDWLRFAMPGSEAACERLQHALAR